MKKSFVLLLSSILMLCGLLTYPAGASSTGKFETAFDLTQYWSETGYPSYICGVSVREQTADKMVLAFGVTDDEMGEAGKAEVLDLIDDTSTVVFITQKYTYAQLCAVQEEVVSRLFSNDEISESSGCGIRESENHVGVYLWEHEGNVDAVKLFVDEMNEQYGDMVHVYKTGRLAEDGDPTTENSQADGGELVENSHNGDSWRYLFLYILVIAIGVGTMVIFKRRARSTST